jgi:hypothetical protein
MDENDIGSRNFQAKQSQQAITRVGGRTTDGNNLTLLAYTPAAEDSIASLPTYGKHREPLQNVDGTFKKRPLLDGTLEIGTFKVDSFGRFVQVT